MAGSTQAGPGSVRRGEGSRQVGRMISQIDARSRAGTLAEGEQPCLSEEPQQSAEVGEEGSPELCRGAHFTEPEMTPSLRTLCANSFLLRQSRGK